MAINKNHEFEELNGIKCAIVEKNASQARVDFLKELLEWNKYTVVVAETVVKAAPAAAAKPAAPASSSLRPVAAETPATIPTTTDGSASNSTATSVPASTVAPVAPVTTSDPNQIPTAVGSAESTSTLPPGSTATAPTPSSASTSTNTPPAPPPPPPSFTIGVTDVSFNWVNAIFGRLLKTKGGRVVTLDYWQQKEVMSRDDTPYFGSVVNEE